ncbi:MAG: hypothetical protein H7318_00885 [Oligoflexus sp.]|nr:hypothetical protein [Oligoflexus sp.]
MNRILTVTLLALFACLSLSCADAPETVTKKTTAGSGNSTPEPVTYPEAPTPSPTPATPPAYPSPAPNPVKPLPSNPVTPSPSTPIVSSGKPLDLVGGIDSTSYYIKVGQISGWAGDKNNTTAYLEVKFYLDGDNKTGKAIGSTKANLVGSDAGVEGDHAFIFEVLPAYIDGKPHKVFAYVTHDGIDTILSENIPLTLTFFKAKGGAAQAAYEKVGFQSRCQGCHSFSYLDRWDAISREGTAGKWTRDNNYLYNKISTGHRVKIDGKTLCDNVQNFSCEAIKTWWDLEFGP